MAPGRASVSSGDLPPNGILELNLCLPTTPTHTRTLERRISWLHLTRHEPRGHATVAFNCPYWIVHSSTRERSTSTHELWTHIVADCGLYIEYRYWEHRSDKEKLYEHSWMSGEDFSSLLLMHFYSFLFVFWPMVLFGRGRSTAIWFSFGTSISMRAAFILLHQLHIHSWWRFNNKSTWRWLLYDKE